MTATTLVNNHHAALDQLRRRVRRVRILTRAMLDRGHRFHADVDVGIVFDRQRHEYIIVALDDGRIIGPLSSIKIVQRPGVCVDCGQIAPCAHSRRA